MNGFRKLKQEVIELQTKNLELTEDLEKTREAETQPKRGKRGGPTVVGLQKEIRSLKTQVSQLQKSQKKDKKKILQLQVKEAKKDAAELEENEDLSMVGDTAYPMRKLLRRFSDLMAANSIDGTEECPICMEKLEVDKTARYAGLSDRPVIFKMHTHCSLPCHHVLCDDCFKQISPNKEEVKCPVCRNEHPRDEVEMIRYTASSQWDALLKIAAKFASMDHRGVEDTSEEEDEEKFVNDDSSELTSQLSQPTSPDPLATSPEPEVEALHAPSTPEAKPDPEDIVLAQTPRKRRAVTTPVTSSEPEGPGDDEPASGSSVKLEKVEDRNGLKTPEPEGHTSLSFALSPISEKKKRLQALADRRSKKRKIG
ncbi:unnamed protein product [Somion occarium]|uniref:RING-type domain-containing protein n=1 Tax=Somion occarium TaxID=3059160 RepID=A0ABP1CZS3_9APHY